MNTTDLADVAFIRSEISHMCWRYNILALCPFWGAILHTCQDMLLVLVHSWWYLEHKIKYYQLFFLDISLFVHIAVKHWFFFFNTWVCAVQFSTSLKMQGQFCKYCKLVNKAGNITCHTTGMVYSSMHNISCRSSSIIYCITCKLCVTQYVGQILSRIKDRIYEHLWHTDQAIKEKPLGLHFSSTKHEKKT